MKKLPYGQTDYKKIIDNNMYYVDKTMYLQKLEDMEDKIIYLRPRRFGKTLFTSMLSYYYDVNSKNIYDDLFKGTYIYDNPAYKMIDKEKDIKIYTRNSYQILKQIVIKY